MSVQTGKGTSPKRRRESEKFVKAMLEKRLARVVGLVDKIAGHKSPTEKEIHDLRTETRRADAAIRLFDDYLAAKRSHALRRQLKQIRETAGATRDHDVLVPRLVTLQATLPQSVATWLVDRAKADRAVTASKCVRRCRKTLRKDFRSKCQSLINRCRYRRSGDIRFGKDCRERISQLHREFELDVDAVATGVDQFHQTRIDARRLRYSLEVISDRRDGPGTTAATELLSNLQDSLGRIHDQQRMIDYLSGAIQACRDDTVAIILRETAAQLQKQLSADQESELESLIEAVGQLRESLVNGGAVLQLDLAERSAS